MTVTEEIRSLIVRRAPAAEMTQMAVSQGMRTLRDDGLDKVRAGETSLAEVARVTDERGLARPAWRGQDDLCMRLRSLAVPAFVAAAVLAVLLTAPAASQAPKTLATIIALDNAFGTDSGGAPNVTIAAGGHVNFVVLHGRQPPQRRVHRRARRPSAASRTDPRARRAALPTAPSPALWEGGCDFDAAGTYAFVCDLHSSMTGSVTVVATGASPPPPPATPDRRRRSSGRRSGRQRAEGRAAAARLQRPRLGARGARRLTPAGARVRPAQGAVAGSRSALEVQVGRQFRSSVGGAPGDVRRPAQRARRAARCAATGAC